MPPPLRSISRRALLGGGLAAAGLIACGGGTRSAAPATAAGSGGGALIGFTPPDGVVRAGLRQRLPFGLANADGALLTEVPDTLEFHVVDEGNREAAPSRRVAAHRQDLPRAYFPLEVELADPGSYTAVVEVGGRSLTAAFSAAAPGQIAIPQVGDAMPVLDTPTTGDHRGVEPLCTRDPVCPLHEVSVADALGSRTPTALLIATPAFCQVAICGPVLEVLLGQQEAFGDAVQLIHAEVYASGAQASRDIQNAALAPTVEAFHLPFEPSLIVADASGTITARLDSIFDRTELTRALAAVA